MYCADCGKMMHLVTFVFHENGNLNLSLYQCSKCKRVDAEQYKESKIESAKPMPWEFIKRLMTQLEKKEITNDQLLEEVQKQGYNIQDVNPDERYVIDGKFLITLFDAIASLGKRAQKRRKRCQ